MIWPSTTNLRTYGWWGRKIAFGSFSISLIGACISGMSAIASTWPRRTKGERRSRSRLLLRFSDFYLYWQRRIMWSGTLTLDVLWCRIGSVRGRLCFWTFRWGSGRSCLKISIKSAWVRCSCPHRSWARSCGRWSSWPSAGPHSRRIEKTPRIIAQLCCLLGPDHAFWWIADTREGGCCDLLVLGF